MLLNLCTIIVGRDKFVQRLDGLKLVSRLDTVHPL